MKVIDLLNKIANGEDVPKKIKIKSTIYELDEMETTYYDEHDMTFMQNYNFKILNEEVEIIEEHEEELQEHKIPEKLENEKEFYAYMRYKENKAEIDKVLYILKALNLTEEKIDNLNNKINEILDYLEEIE